MRFEDAVGLVGAILSTLATIPQAWKARRRGTTEGLHLLTFFVHFVSACIWAFYGFLIGSWILLAECSIVAILNLYVCICILRDKCDGPAKRYLAPDLQVHAED